MIEDSSRSALLQSDFSRHHSKKLPLLCKFVDDEYEICCFYYLVKIDDVGMSDFFHYVYLSLNPDLIVLVLNAVLIDDLNGYFLSSLDVNALFDFSKGALA